MTTEDDHDDQNEDNYHDHYDTTESDCNNDAVSLSTQSLLPTVQCCTHSCCHNMLEVSQPLDPLILKKTERLYGSIKRAFTPTWYKSYPWIDLCTSNFKVYCFYCKYVVHNLQIVQNKILLLLMSVFLMGRKVLKSLRPMRQVLLTKMHA